MPYSGCPAALRDILGVTHRGFDKAGRVDRTPLFYRIRSDGLPTDGYGNRLPLTPLVVGVTIPVLRVPRSGRFHDLWPQRLAGEKDSFHSS